MEKKSNGYGNGSVSGLFRGTSQEVIMFLDQTVSFFSSKFAHKKLGKNS